MSEVEILLKVVEMIPDFISAFATLDMLVPAYKKQKKRPV